MSLIDELIKERAALQARIDSINQLLDMYDNIHVGQASFNKGSTAMSGDKFPINAKTLSQIIFLIKQEGRFLHNSEIVELLMQNGVSKSKEDLKRRVSAVLSQAKTKGEGNLTNVRHGKSIQNTFWGSLSWLDANKKVIDKHLYIVKENDNNTI